MSEKLVNCPLCAKVVYKTTIEDGACPECHRNAKERLEMTEYLEEYASGKRGTDDWANKRMMEIIDSGGSLR